MNPVAKSQSNLDTGFLSLDLYSSLGKCITFYWKIKLIFSVSVAHKGRLWAIIKGQAGEGLRSTEASV